MQPEINHTPIKNEIIRLDLSDLDIISAHEKLGMEVQTQVHKILDEKINAVNFDEFANSVRKARLIKLAIEQKIISPNLNPLIIEALIAYKRSLYAWASGAKLDGYNHIMIEGKTIDGISICGQDLSIILQTEQFGCQTGIIRDEDGSILLWHTEEDVEPIRGARFDLTRIFSFRYEDKIIHSFVYPDLLPGPAFGWKNDSYVQAVDSLYVKTNPDNNSIPPNILTWLALCLGGEVPITEIINALGPFQSGYSITSISRSPNHVSGEKVEFVSNQFERTQLPNEFGKYLFQVNMISDRHSLLKKKYEDISGTTESSLQLRINRTEDLLEEFTQSSNKIRFLHSLLASVDGGEYAYANKDVKAFFLCRISNTGLKNWIGNGSAKINNDIVQWM